MGDAQRAQAEIDIAAKRQVIRAQIDDLLERHPHLRASHESSPANIDHVSGAAAQNYASKHHPNFLNMAPRLHAANTFFHDSAFPTDSMQGAAAHWYDSAQNQNKILHNSSECQTYQSILQNSACASSRILGGFH